MSISTSTGVREIAERPCIERRSLLGNIEGLTVAEYDRAIQRTKRIGTLRGLSFHELTWTRDAPPVEKLTPAWQKPREDAMRITDSAAYHIQMRRLIGLD